MDEHRNPIKGGAYKTVLIPQVSQKPLIISPGEHQALSPSQIIHKQFGRFLEEKEYPQPLPDELKPWYCYAKAYGHSLAVLLKSRLTSYREPKNFLELAPVKTVLRGYTMMDGHILIDASYDSQRGLRVPPQDSEW